MTTAIEIGRARDGAPASFDLRELLSTRLLVQGNSGSGKSHLLRRLLEQSAGLVQQVVVDPEGDFTTLAGRHGHLVVDAGDHAESALATIAERVRRHRVSVVLNLESVEVDQQLRCAAAFLNGLFEVERDAWYPVLVVVDEAQLFAPALGGEASDEARRQSLAAMTNLMCRGRKRGLAGVIATQRLAKLAKNVAAEASNFLMGRTFLDIDMARAADLLGMERRQAEMFRDLERGHFVALGPAIARRPLAVRIGEVETATRSAGPELLPPAAPPSEEARELILKAPEPTALPPRRAPRPPSPDLLEQLARYQPPAPEARTEADEAERATRIQTALRQVADSGFATPSELYQDFLLRLRVLEVTDAPDLAEFRRLLATARAGVEPETSDEGWQEAIARANALPEDAQGVYLLLARAAREAAPCPPDAAIARAYGTQSLGRARRLLAWLEERNAIVVRPVRGGRVVALVGLGWETGAGDAAEAA
jgi:hypothetical protein